MQTIPKTRSQNRLVTIALVAAIHAAAIYALIVTLNPHLLAPPPQRPITIDFVPPTATPPATQPVDPRSTFINPGVVAPPTPPTVTTDSGPRVTLPPTAGMGGSATGPFVPTYAPPHGVFGTHTTPDYPPIAARLNEQGSVRLELRIDEQGIVTDATVLNSSGYHVLDDAAVIWVKSRWRYSPALRDGAPISSSTDAIVTFRLTNRQG
jgi:protein TonB